MLIFQVGLNITQTQHDSGIDKMKHMSIYVGLLSSLEFEAHNSVHMYFFNMFKAQMPTSESNENLKNALSLSTTTDMTPCHTDIMLGLQNGTFLFGLILHVVFGI